MLLRSDKCVIKDNLHKRVEVDILKAGFHMIADRNKVCDRLRSCDRDRRRSLEPCWFPYDRSDRIAICDHMETSLKGWFPYDRGSQIAIRSAIDLRSYGNYFCDRLRSCDRDRRRSQKIESCSISCDQLRLFAICDLRSAIIWKPAFR